MNKNFLKEIGINVITLPNGLHVMDTHLTNGQGNALGWEIHESFYDNLPLVNISWNEVKDVIIPAFSTHGIQMRMLTDAEAEYLLRLNNYGEVTSGDFPFQEDELDKYAVYGQKSVAPVKSKSPIYGLYDVRGNCYTWCEDLVDSLRVLRGGSFRNDPRGLRSAYRCSGPPGNRYDDVGVRLVIENYPKCIHDLNFKNTLDELLKD